MPPRSTFPFVGRSRAPVIWRARGFALPPRPRGKHHRPRSYLSTREKVWAVLAAPATWLLLFLVIPLVLVAAVGFATVQKDYLLSFTDLTFDPYADVLDPS